MALESKPLFHPEVIRQQVRAFNLPERVADWQAKLQHWAGLISSGRADDFKETALLPDFLTDIFCGLLGYTGPAGSPDTFTFSRERHVEVDGEVADAVLGRFQRNKEQFVAVLEGKGARDPLDRPFAGRRMSAVDQAYRSTQKLLDRVLFCAFCEDRGLLPAESLKQAFEHRDPYNPKPVWQNFRGLFRAIDEGNAGLNIPAYNGGLFATDPALDALQVPDEVCAHFKDLGDYDYRPAREIADADENTEVRSVIDVDILGHIFEQSITDLERLRLSLEAGAVLPLPGGEGRGEGELRSGGLPVDETQARKRRKQEGAVYTPAFITRYIVGQALGGVLKQRFEALRQQHEAEAAGTARKALADPNAYDLTALNEPQRKALIRFWEACQEALKRLRILDLACGSGAFLIEAFDQLHALYEISNARLEELRGQRTLFDLDRQILQHNLYGVDLNAEAIQICQLSLWIKTTARGKQLTSLDHTIREGNSVISDPTVHPKAFDWQAAFPEVFAQGGFDVVMYFHKPPVHCRERILTE